MREIISIHIGQAGVQLGEQMWDLFCREHGINENGGLIEQNATGGGDDSVIKSDAAPRLNFNELGDGPPTLHKDQAEVSSFFVETACGRYTPRCLFIDLEPSVIDSVRCGRHQNLFAPHRLIVGQEDAITYARGRYVVGREVLDNAIAAMDLLIEGCDNLQGIMVFHSYGGGSGSGFFSLLTQYMYDLYHRKPLEFAVFPSPQFSTAIVEPYNAVLATNSTIEMSDCVFFADNQAMYDICSAKLDIDQPMYKNLNRLLAQVVSSITASLRFKGTLNADFKDYQTNLVPYPKIHFQTMSYSPITSSKGTYVANHPVYDITSALFEQESQLNTNDVGSGRYISCVLLYRGDVTPKDVNAAILKVKNTKNLQFVDWSPTGFKIGMNGQAPFLFSNSDLAPTNRAVCMIANTTSVHDTWFHLNNKYHTMVAKRAFFYWYEFEGMELEEFYEAGESLLELEEEYLLLNSG